MRTTHKIAALAAAVLVPLAASRASAQTPGAPSNGTPSVPGAPATTQQDTTGGRPMGGMRDSARGALPGDVKRGDKSRRGRGMTHADSMKARLDSVRGTRSDTTRQSPSSDMSGGTTGAATGSSGSTSSPSPSGSTRPTSTPPRR